MSATSTFGTTARTAVSPTSTPSGGGATGIDRAPAPRRQPKPTPGWWRDAGAMAFWGILLFATGLCVSNGGLQDLVSGWGMALTSLGRITALISSALLLVQVFLMARVPFVEHAWGQDKLTQTHRWVGFTSFTLMMAHIVLITLGYAADMPGGIWGTIVDFVVNYPGMLLALGGTVALCMVVVTSFKKAPHGRPGLQPLPGRLRPPPHPTGRTDSLRRAPVVRRRGDPLRGGRGAHRGAVHQPAPRPDGS